MSADQQWEQGSLLELSHAARLGLPVEDGDLFILMTHDCDCAQGRGDDFVEVMTGKQIDKVDAQCTRARHPRRIHLSFQSADGTLALHGEFTFLHVQRIRKEDFFASDTPPDPLRVGPDEKRGYKQWLAARYGRPAFPNAFEDRLKDVEKPLRNAVRSDESNQHILSVFFDLGDARFKELTDEPYELTIYLIADYSQHGDSSLETARIASERIDQCMRKAYGAPEDATLIEYQGCRVIPDSEFRLSQIRRMDLWRFGYRSLQKDGASVFSPETEVD